MRSVHVIELVDHLFELEINLVVCLLIFHIAIIFHVLDILWAWRCVYLANEDINRFSFVPRLSNIDTLFLVYTLQ